MRVLTSLSSREEGLNPVSLTIGSFDGVHLGHQAILKELQSESPVCVVTFSNHPSHVLPGKEETKLILSPNLKLEWLEHFGVDFVYLLEFTKEIAAMSYVEFLEALLPFERLVLGKGATLGRKREGTEERVTALGLEKGFSTHYLDKLENGLGPISSGRIRKEILQGHISCASELLGHPYQIEGEVLPTGEFRVDSRTCLPPDGTYSVEANHRKDPISTTLTIRAGKCHLPLPPCKKTQLLLH